MINWLPNRDTVKSNLFLFTRALRNTIDRNGFSLFMYICVSLVLIFVPQIAKIWWVLPGFSSGEFFKSVVVWLYIPAFLLFYKLFCFGLLRVGGLDVGRLVLFSFVFFLILLLSASVVGTLWDDLFAAGLWSTIAFYVLVPLFLTMFYLSWICLLEPKIAWEKETRRKPIVYLFERVRLVCWPWPVEPVGRFEIPSGLQQTIHRGWFQALMGFSCLIMGTLNLIVLLLIHAVCGFWVGLLTSTVRKYPWRSSVTAAILTLLIIIGHQQLAHSTTRLLYPASQAFFGLIVFPLILLCLWICVVAFS